jgi:cytochrome c oxidase cbb3-type subunit 3
MNETDPTRLMEHDYDGIREYDNPLPGWWTWLFIISFVFSVIYVAWYHVGTVSKSVHEKFDAQVAAYYEDQLERLGITEADDATIVRLMHDEDMMTAVAGMFQGNCAQCHRADGGGNVGPNLTDDYWKSVETPSDIYDVITLGVPGTAMTPWDRRLREPQRILLAAYVAYIRGSNPPGGLPQDGDRIDPWPSLESFAPTDEDVAGDESE